MTLKLTHISSLPWKYNTNSIISSSPPPPPKPMASSSPPPPPKPMASSSPPLSHQDHKSFSPPEGSPAESTKSFDHTSHGGEDRTSVPSPEHTPSNPPARPLSPIVISNRLVRDEPAVVTKVNSSAQDGNTSRVVEEGHGGVGGVGRKSRPASSMQKWTMRDTIMKRSMLGVRVCGFVLCLISFSVMAADKNQGWALDSFDRYIEFRYCMSVNVIGFVYSAAQAIDVACHLAARNYIAHHILRYYFNFFMDQVISYLLISASSSAATRVDDWVLNWGKDKFPQMASASLALSFLAFVALASSALISGYNLCTLSSS